MRVTICFGSFRIVVPVGDGTITVAELTQKALERFRKACQKGRQILLLFLQLLLLPTLLLLLLIPNLLSPVSLL